MGEKSLVSKEKCHFYACFQIGRCLGELPDRMLIDKMTKKYGEHVREIVTEVVVAWRADPEHFGKKIF